MIEQLPYPSSLEETHIPTTLVGKPDIFALPYQLPRIEPQPPPEAVRLVRDIQLATGWSARTLGDVIGTTHPTIRALQRGRVAIAPRNRDYQRRLLSAYEVITRIHALANRDVTRTNAALRYREHGPSAIHLIAADRPSEAYLAALRALRPSRRDRLIVGSRPLSPRGRTVDPFSEE
jgi:hypothetical protein